MKTPIPLALFGLLLSAQYGFAEADKYRITPEERVACQQDAAVFCGTSADEDELIVCMKQNKPQLSNGCLKTFEAGLRKRHLS